MKKLFISIAILLLGGIGYLTYQQWSSSSNLTVWSFISADVAVVVEADLAEDITSLKNYAVWQSLSQTEGTNKLHRSLQFLDSINGKGGFSTLFKKVPILIAAQKVADDRADFLYVAELKNITQNTFVNAAIQKVSKQGHRIKKRNYSDFTISELQLDDSQLTYLFHKNFFIASFTPYLVEDAIRVLNEAEMGSFRELFFPNQKLTGTKGIDLYVNYESLNSLLSAFASSDIEVPLSFGKIDLTLDSSYFQMSGFSSASGSWMNTHTTQPSTFDMAEIVPENTAYLQHITATDIEVWKEKQMQFLRNNRSIKRFQDTLRASFDFHSDQVFDLIENEIGMISLESPRSNQPLKMLILEVKDAQESINFFSKLTARVAAARGDSVYVEAYSENEIRFLPISEFPQAILGEMAEGFPQCFYINYRNYLIFSNDLPELKKLIEGIENEETWGKSIHMNQFLQRTNQAANFSLFVNLPRAWNMLIDQLKPSWQPYFRKQAQAFRTFELAAFQYSYVDGKYYTNYTYTQPQKRKDRIPKTNPENGVQFVSKIITKAHLLRTHAHRDFDILLQDSTRTLYYLDPEQNALWSESLEGIMKESIHPIDYYKNGKLQCLFATQDKVHIIDRTGAYIPGYPKSLPSGSKIAYMNLIDYDRSRNYRIAITDSEGNIYLTDKDLKPLPGWNPLRMKRESLSPLQHYRIGRKDLMIVLKNDGEVAITNRRGDPMPGFPFDTKQELAKHFFIRATNGLATSSITVLSKDGEITELTLEGGLIRKDQLIKPTVNTDFSLVPDTGNESFIIIRRNGHTYDVLDDTGNLIFSKDYLSGGPIQVQYYEFGAGKDLVVFTDQATNSLYIYDKAGNLVTGNPLNSANEVSLIYSRANKFFEVYSTHGVNLEIYKFRY